MKEKNVNDLIQREIDGVLSPGEESLLRELAAKDAGVAQLRRSLHGVSRILAGLERREPPPTLRPSAMRAVETRANAPQRRSVSVAEAVSTFLHGISPRGAFAGGLVAGLLVALIGVIAIVPDTMQESELIGTALLTESVPVLAPTASVAVVANGVSGSLTMESSGEFQVATVVLASGESEHAAVLTYPADQVRLAAVRPDGPGSVPVNAGAGRIELQHQTRTRLELLFTVVHDASAPLRITVQTADGAKHQAEIAFGPPASR
jgi:anti-sigma factor RsiW